MIMLVYAERLPPVPIVTSALAFCSKLGAKVNIKDEPTK